MGETKHVSLAVLEVFRGLVLRKWGSNWTSYVEDTYRV